MTVYYVDDGGSSTAPYDTWAKAATSLSALDDAVTFASEDIVYIGHDHVCQYTHSASRTITGPTSGKPTKLISATTGSDPPVYQKSSTLQVDTSEGNYKLYFAGSWALYGVKVRAGEAFLFYNQSDESGCNTYDCTVGIGPTGYITAAGDRSCTYNKNLTVDLTSDGTTNRSTVVFSPVAGRRIDINGLSFINPGYRTFAIISNIYSGNFRLDGANFSGLASSCEIVDLTNIGPDIIINNCITAETWTPFYGTQTLSNCGVILTNVGPANSPTYIAAAIYQGMVISSTSIYRTSGATVETVACSWLVTTTANCSEGTPFLTPWIYGTVASAGSKTFDLYITNDTADLTDAEVWLEIEYLATDDSGQWSLATDQRATILTTAVVQTDDTTSTWNGTGPNFTYKQKLSVTATIGEPGLFRARVAVGKASIASSSYFYIDPKVTVS